MKLVMKVMRGCLVPQERDLDEFFKLKTGGFVQCNITMPRNLPFHNKYMGMLKLAYKNQEIYPSFEIFHDVVKLGVGHVEVLVMPDGQVNYRPKSISFGNMEQPEFDEYFNRVGDYIQETFGIEWSDLERNHV